MLYTVMLYTWSGMLPLWTAVHPLHPSLEDLLQKECWPDCTTTQGLVTPIVHAMRHYHHHHGASLLAMLAAPDPVDTRF